MSEHFIFPFVRFAIRVPLRTGDRHGPRFSYVPSLYIVESGFGSILYADGAVLRLQTGTMFFIQPGIMHTWQIDEEHPLTFRCVFFEWTYRTKTGMRVPGDLLRTSDEDRDGSLLDEPSDSGLPTPHVVDSIGLWNGLFRSVTDEFESVSPQLSVLSHDDYPRSLAVHGHFHLLLHQLYRLAKRQADHRDPRIVKLMAMMEKDAGVSAESVDIWAEKLGMSRSYFQTLFHAQTGFTPKWYWNRCRLNKACNDLLISEDAVTLIAERHGFSSVHAFSKFFHKMEGISPSDFRRRSRLI